MQHGEVAGFVYTLHRITSHYCIVYIEYIFFLKRKGRVELEPDIGLRLVVGKGESVG